VSDVTDDQPTPTSVSALTRFLLSVIADPTSLDDGDDDASVTPQADATEHLADGPDA
jgi:hypothetical protein